MTGHPSLPDSRNLKTILACEIEMLQSGRVSDAAALIDEKMAAMRDLEVMFEAKSLSKVTPSQRLEIEEIIQMAKLNAVHFEAIQNGVRNVIARIENLDGNAYVGSYKPGGGKVAFPEASGRYSKKS